MPLHDFLCPDCGTEATNIYVPLKDIDVYIEWCACGQEMDFDFRIKTKRKTRSNHFPEFTAQHLTRLKGKPVTITSLADVRRIEKEHQDEEVCFEAFSFDTKDGSRVDQTPEPTRLSEDQKRAFIEEFRERNIKAERS